MKIPTRLCCLFFCFGLIATTGTYAATVSIISSADAFVTAGSLATGAGSPTENYGAAGALMISGVNAAKGEIQSLLKFNLATAKITFDTQYGAGNWFINNITLQLATNFGTQGAQPNNTIFNTINSGLFKLDWQANDNWAEGVGNPSSNTTPANPPTDGVTYATIGSLIGGTDENLGTFTYTAVGDTNSTTIPPATYSLGLSSGFTADVTAGNQVSLRGYAGDANVGYLFNSYTFGTAANRPTLLVSAVPEASTFWQFGIAAIGFSALFHRRRKLA